MREQITIACTECRSHNYTSTRNKKKTPDRLQIKKFCKMCRKHTSHKENK
ncbi:MAG: 50S ribosomal protein L33 [Candidatus Omnitrophota bacterium]